MTTLDPRALTTCPFCDGKATVMESSHPSGGWYAQCTECNADGPSRDEYGQAAVAWNSRALSQPALAVKGLAPVDVYRILKANADEDGAVYREKFSRVARDIASLVASPPPSGEASLGSLADEQAAFEAWAKNQWTNGQSIPRTAWMGWEARALSSSPATADGWRKTLKKIEYSLTKDSLCKAEKIDDALYLVRRALSKAAAPTAAGGR